MISKKIKIFTLNRSCIEYFGKHCCKITYKRSLIILHVYFFSLFPIAPCSLTAPQSPPFFLPPLNLANAPWGAVAPTLGTTGLDKKNFPNISAISLCSYKNNLIIKRVNVLNNILIKIKKHFDYLKQR